MKKVSICEVCGNPNLDEVLDLGSHPMCDDLVPISSDIICEKYPINILYCSTCHTAHQKYQVAKSKLFPLDYHYRSRLTNDVINGMKDLVEATISDFCDVENKIVLDIGSNDGSLLDIFKKYGAITIGVEPTNATLDAAKKSHVIYHDYFVPEIATKIREDYGLPAVITFTNVFAHIEDLNQLLSTLEILIDENTLLVVENHYLGSILEGYQFDTFYHEHPRTYSATSFVHIAKKLKMHINRIDFPSRYGGNIRVFMSRQACKNQDVFLDQIKVRERSYESKIKLMQAAVEKWKYKKNILIKNLVKKHGILYAKAFPGRASILVNLLGIDELSVSAVYEKQTSLKIGYYVPSTRIPIISDEKLFNSIDKSSPILNFAWHISHEIRSYLDENGVTNPLIDIVSKSDFE
jgi:hypothetical protein